MKKDLRAVVARTIAKHKSKVMVHPDDTADLDGFIDDMAKSLERGGAEFDKVNKAMSETIIAATFALTLQEWFEKSHYHKTGGIRFSAIDPTVAKNVVLHLLENKKISRLGLNSFFHRSIIAPLSEQIDDALRRSKAILNLEEIAIILDGSTKLGKWKNFLEEKIVRMAVKTICINIDLPDYMREETGVIDMGNDLYVHIVTITKCGNYVSEAAKQLTGFCSKQDFFEFLLNNPLHKDRVSTGAIKAVIGDSWMKEYYLKELCANGIVYLDGDTVYPYKDKAKTRPYF